jgi:uncharacterized protein
MLESAKAFNSVSPACFFWRLCYVFIVLCLGGCKGPANVVPVAQSFLDAVVGQEFDEAYQRLSASAQEVLPAFQIAKIWEELNHRHGLFVTWQSATELREFSATRVIFVGEFQRDLVEVAVVLNVKSKVVGWLFRRVGTNPKRASIAVLPEGVREVDVEIGAEPWALGATLALGDTIGKAPGPAFLFVHGSGPQDRNERVGAFAPFLDLAHGLAKRGIVSVRYDKRTRQYPKTFRHGESQAGQGLDLTIENEVLLDAVAGLKFLAERPEVDRTKLFVLGHDLGGMLLARIAKQFPSLRGGVALAAHARPLEDIYRDMDLRRIDSQSSSHNKSKEKKQVIEAWARVKDPSLNQKTSSAKLLRRLPASYWLSVRELHPPQEFAAIDKPFVVMLGERDAEIPATDHKLWQERLVSPKQKVRIYKGVNHLMMVAAAKGQSADEAMGISEEIINDIMEFANTGMIKDD